MSRRPPLNEKLIACVLDHIERHPDEYNQNTWCRLVDQENDGEFCGTAGCFAGWAVLLSTPVAEWEKMQKYCDQSGVEDWQQRAMKLLGLTGDETFLFQSVPGHWTPQMAVAVIKKRLNSIRLQRGLPTVDYAAAVVKGAKVGEEEVGHGDSVSEAE